MKIARFVLKIVAASLAFAAAVCCVIAYWDKLAELACCVKDKASTKIKTCSYRSEYDDYADWEMDA